jgi:glycosyltransferase involved in cell wall biosynthesis
VTARSTARVVYGGGLHAFGTTGSHPQFRHIARPPEGYEFVLPPPAWRWERIPGLVVPVARLIARGLSAGVSPSEVANFLWSRGPRTQLGYPRDADLVFLPTWLMIVNQLPWVVEIEDNVTLFAPYVRNGETRDVDVARLPCLRLVRALLESSACRAIISHVRATAESIPGLFGRPTLADKTHFLPLGIDAGDEPAPRPPGHRLLFTNSWHQGALNFYYRGGIDVLEAFAALRRRYPDVTLTLRTGLPDDLPPRYRDMCASPGVRVIDEKLSDRQMDDVVGAADVFLLPAARIHVVSILHAMARGAVVVASDGWGIEEYVTHDVNGLIVRGRYGVCSWTSPDGLLREDYRSLRSVDGAVVRGLVESVTRLFEAPQLWTALRAAAAADARGRFSLNAWNRGLKRIFDGALKGA